MIMNVRRASTLILTVIVTTALAHFSPASVEADDEAARKVLEVARRDFERHALSSIDSFCGNRWPDDHVMHNRCFDEQVTARSSLQAKSDISKVEKMKVWATCVAKWQDKQDRTDWVMADRCFSEQLEALDKIKRRQHNLISK